MKTLTKNMSSKVQWDQMKMRTHCERQAQRRKKISVEEFPGQL